LTNGFVVWDDALLVTKNPIAHGLTWANIKAAFTTYDPELYIPLTLLSFQINYSLHELLPFGYHLVNLLLHFGSVLMIAWVMFGMTKNRVAAIVTALLFAVHPINVEAVAWVSGRKDVLAAFFFLLSIGAFLKKDDSDRSWLWYAISIASFVLGLLAKVSVVTLPVALLLIDWYRQKPLSKKTWMELIPFFALSIVFVIIASLGKSSTDEFFIEKLLMGALSIVLHLVHIVFPIGFSRHRADPR
jgi:4-amino-4-deoxy-L-arabinose transferase-like glycosyltransferase